MGLDIMTLIYGVCCVYILITWRVSSKSLLLSLDGLSKVAGVIFALTLLRIATLSFAGVKDLGVSSVHFSDILSVWWEDTFFALPIFLLKDSFNLKKRVWLTVAIVLSLLFGFAHSYQGNLAIAMFMFAPYFVSYKIIREYGLLTAISAHICYDIATLSLIKLYPVLVG